MKYLILLALLLIPATADAQWIYVQPINYYTVPVVVPQSANETPKITTPVVPIQAIPIQTYLYPVVPRVVVPRRTLFWRRPFIYW